MRLILVRHGESEHNAKEIMQGHLHSELTKRGKEQASKTAKALKDEKIGVIFSSDLKRASQTAAIINKYHKLDIKHLKDLRERSFGKFEGKHYSVLLEAVKKSGKAYHEFRPELGESCLDICKKMVCFLNYLLIKHSNQTVLVVTHGGNILELIFYLTKTPREQYEKYKPSNSSITIFAIDKNKNCKSLIINSKKEEIRGGRII